MSAEPHRLALRDAAPKVFWLDDPSAPPPQPRLEKDIGCDLAVVGGGYTGLWTALLARHRDPSCDVVILESHRAGWAASGRNGGFCDASLTHGFANGLNRFPDELDRIEELGMENFEAIQHTIRERAIDCDFETNGAIDAATQPWQLEQLADAAEAMRDHGHDVTLLDATAMRGELDSPTYAGGLWNHQGAAIVNPARLAWGLRRACVEDGVRIHEQTAVTSLRGEPGRVQLTTPQGSVRARRVALAGNAFPPLLRRLRLRIVPVYDYVLVTEPLTTAQLGGLGWARRQGISDAGNQFHYYRLTADNRILWGGYDAVYHFGNRIGDELDQRPATFEKLASHFFATFPQLEGIRFTHSWGGAIDTCSRFCAFWGTACGGRVAYTLGYTGLGVGASRFGAEVMLDLLEGRRTERTSLRMVRTKPLPFPPEPLRYGVIQLTRWSLERADRNRGRRNLWLRTLDRMGLGFDS